MVQVVPFKGLLYDQEKCGSLQELIAPPYDVIKPHQQEALYDKNPSNVVRLILGKQFPDDNESNNRYTRSARDFIDWQNQGILVEDARPCFYAYSQSYEFEHRKVHRIGFFARIRLEDFTAGNICPHEFTLAKAKKDRARLIEACRANFSPVFGLFSDPSRSVDDQLIRATQTDPLGVIEDTGITHKLWRIADDGIISFLTRAMVDKKIYIADGHHRYETALAYSKSQKSGDDSDHVMMFLTNLESESLTVFAIHRLIRSPDGFDSEAFFSHLEDHFDVQSLPERISPKKIQSLLSQEGDSKNVFIAYLGHGKGYLLKVNDVNRVVPYLKNEEPTDLKVLDIMQLHAMLIRPALKVDTLIPEHQQFVSYTIDIKLAMDEVNAGNYHVTFFMNPTRVSQVRELAEKGVRLPQKATYFHPKLLSGLVINKFRS